MNGAFKMSKYIREEKPFGFFEYIKLQENAFCVLSDSGTLTEESSILDFPAVLIRTSTERQEGVIHGSIIQGGVDFDTIDDAIGKVRLIHNGKNHLSIVPDYDCTDVSSQVVAIIKQYVDVINKETWLKE
jgi:UDP-N-acetylglucosamine 2-epimerase